MFTRILVPLNGSERAERAVPVAARIARAANGTMILMQVTQLPSNFYTQGKYPSQMYPDGLIEEGKARASNYLDNVRRKPELIDLKTETCVEFGDAAQSILAAVAQRLTKGDVPGLTITTSLAVNVDVAEALVRVAEQELLVGGHFDLVAMATHGRSGLQRLLMGSVTDHVMSATHLPMLVVHSSVQSKQAQVSNEQRVGAIA